MSTLASVMHQSQAIKPSASKFIIIIIINLDHHRSQEHNLQENIMFNIFYQINVIIFMS
jgi:hypothetical protein